MLATFHQRQRTLADEVDLEAEQRVEPVGSRLDALSRRLDAKQSRDEAADVRRHPHDQVGAFDRRWDTVGRGAVQVPGAPQVGIGRSDLLAEPIVQIAQAQGLVQVGVGKTGDAERLRLVRLIHLILEVTRLCVHNGATATEALTH